MIKPLTERGAAALNLEAQHLVAYSIWRIIKEFRGLTGFLRVASKPGFASATTQFPGPIQDFFLLFKALKSVKKARKKKKKGSGKSASLEARYSIHGRM